MITTNFCGYAVPIAGPAGRYADHTCVYGIINGALQVSEFTCHGIQRNMPAAPPDATATGNLYEVLAMVNGNMLQRNPPLYNMPQDDCGITYGISGVCHQMANRILFTAGTLAYNPFAGNVRGLALSTAIYGVFGRTHVPMMQRLNDAIYMVQNSGMGAAKCDCDISYEDEILKRMIESKKLYPPLKIMMLKELLGVSDIKVRINMLIKDKYERMEQKFSMGKIYDAAGKLEDYLKDCAAADGSSIPISEINEKIQSFDAVLYEVLGPEAYKEVFGNNYDKDFILCTDCD